MKVFVTGVEGYIGALLAPALVQRGFDVVGTDTGYYRDGWLYSDPRIKSFPLFVNRDLRQITENDLRGFDAVVHLAELSNDPLGQNKPEVTFKINHQGSVELARKAKAVGVKRFVYTSSCSVYGVGSGDFLNEQSPVNPQTSTPSAKYGSSATSASWPTIVSRRFFCATRRRTGRRRGCVSISC
jgi:nucleoside-diphosphate-sugar epimerase